MEVGESALLYERLERAQRKISTLEEFIRDREVQFSSYASRARERRGSMRDALRMRRAGRSHDMMMQTSVSLDRTAAGCGLDDPLGEYICLTIERIRSSHESDDDTNVPFSLTRLVSKQYHIGPEGASLGTSPDCTVCLPRESGLKERHVEFHWVPGSQCIPVGNEGTPPSPLTPAPYESESERVAGHFVMTEYPDRATTAEGTHTGHQPDTIMEVDEDPFAGDCGTPPQTCNAGPSTRAMADIIFPSQPRRVVLLTGRTFVTGLVEWSITALPPDTVLLMKMFAAVRSGSLERLKSIVDGNHGRQTLVPHVAIASDTREVGGGRGEEEGEYSHSILMAPSELGGVDLNAELCLPSLSTLLGEEPKGVELTQTLSSEAFKSAVAGSSAQSLPASRKVPLQSHSKLLLHVAIDNDNLEMVQYLLEQGADVNRCVGEQGQNALHLAARLNRYPIMVELLKGGGDMEIGDVNKLQPLALTSSYKIRMLLLNSMLLCAGAEAGDEAEVTRLLSHTPVSPNAKCLGHKTALHMASACGHVTIVNLLLLNGATVDLPGGSRKRTALHYAVANNHPTVAQTLLSAGANQFVRDSGGYTPLNLCKGEEICKMLITEPLSLCLAVQSWDLDEVTELLKRGEGEETSQGTTHIDQRNEQSHAPLHLACTAGNMEMVKLLVTHGANINLHGGSDWWTPLFYAAMAGHANIVEFLLSIGANPKECDVQGNTVLERVEQMLDESKDRLEQIVKRGRSESINQGYHTLMPASMVRQESSSCSSIESEHLWLSTRMEKLKAVSSVLTSGPEKLLKAIEEKNLVEFRNLIESGAVSAEVVVDKECPSQALARVCEDGLYEFADVLLKHGAKPFPSGPSEQIPFLLAARTNRSDLLSLMVSHGCSVNSQASGTLSTALHEAAETNSLGAVKYLLSAGAQASIQNALGELPFDCSNTLDVKNLLAHGPTKLLLAATTGDHEAIERLVQGEGLSAGHAFLHGRTALHEACQCGHVEVVRTLLRLGADVNAQEHRMQSTPLHMAVVEGCVGVVQELLKSGAKLDIKDIDGKVPFEVAATNQMRRLLVEARKQPVVCTTESCGEKKCMICADNPINTILLPCGHQAFCTSCTARISICALDRQPIREVITIYK